MIKSAHFLPKVFLHRANARLQLKHLTHMFQVRHSLEFRIFVCQSNIQNTFNYVNVHFLRELVVIIY